MKAIIVSLLVALSAPLMAADVPTLNPKKPRTVVFLNYFRLYDTNGDSFLSEAEFQGTLGSSSIPAITKYRFLFMADAGPIAPSGIEGPIGIGVESYIRFAGGLRVPKVSKATIFELADEDNDNFLDPSEYALTRNSDIPAGALGKPFNRLDRDDDNLISRSEFGLNVKG
ncbi:EF-hand domain-containing protein [Luteolibacter luteus]|uniref:EF-hand domain-containing protein n=1 Tax=Luteolibacter luteus TaxID=2728835 RepID=A0A858RLY6_9BACT|nr:EF-hand domain-containing protein [Luteolibacter luteus]QJE97003.1 EF-hand domain-containing protein [Luteolibacter luteus]